MKGSLAVSLGLHAAILAAALVVLPNPKHDVMPVEAITVDISNIADANKLMATAKDAEQPVEAPAPKKAEVVRKTDETLKVADEERKAAKEVKAPPLPEPEPKTEDVKKEELPPPKKEEPAKKAQETPKPVKKPEKKPEKKSAKLDTAKLEELLNTDALLDKENDEKTTDASEAITDGQPAPGERDLQGKDQSLSATTISARGTPFSTSSISSARSPASGSRSIGRMCPACCSCSISSPGNRILSSASDASARCDPASRKIPFR
jgi:outer membrane biosynthesis protein TonB